ncbi:methyltransferase domain-containing protein [Synechococcus sp. W4D4]|uniref:methyltransferase domain-containing protein n=1 Tax=Synechococcus sp. W4D4 TaxID=3392294 RepID=UPI0039EC5A16
MTPIALNNACRVCRSTNMAAVVDLEDVPKSAQYFPHNANSDKNHDSIRLRIKQCMHCGHVQTCNDPVSYYKDVITAASLSEPLWQARKRVLLKLADKVSPDENLRLLEVGAAKGQNIKKIKEDLGWDAVGLEHNINSINHAQSQGIPVQQGYIQGNEDFASSCLPILGKFDIIVIYNFLEHMVDPSGVLTLLHQILNKNGIIYATVPSLDFIASTNCVHEFIADHLSYFSKETLEHLFVRANYDVIYANRINNGNDLEIACKKKAIQSCLARVDIGLFKSFVVEINRTIAQCRESGCNIIFWGAGHRSLTLLSQLDYGKIDAIVDSAPFKQGLFGPVSRLPIISPQALRKRKGKIALYISLPGIYADEVIAGLEESDFMMDCIYKVHEQSIETIKPLK